MNLINSGGRPLIPLELAGINEQDRYASDSKVTTRTLGYLQRDGLTLELPNGISRLFATDASKVLSIHQSFNSSGLIYIQTENALYSVTEDEVFGRSLVSTLTKNPLLALEDMSLAIITHAQAAGVGGGPYTTAATWQPTLINTIESQFTTAGIAPVPLFVALPGAGVIRLVGPARYRINGWVKFATKTAGNRWQARLYRTVGAPVGPVFLGQGFEIVSGTSSTGSYSASANDTTHCGVAHLGGEFTCTTVGTEDYEIQCYAAASSYPETANQGSGGLTGVAFGRAQNVGVRECYASFSIWRVY